MPFLVALLLIVFILLAALALLAFWPLGLGGIASHPRPAASYDAAVQRVAALQAQEDDGVRPDCRTRLLGHGARAARAVVLFHGYTAGVPQFVPLGQQFFDRGDNVLLVRLPHHGQTDRLTEQHGRLLATELAALADEAVDIAAGLGERLIVMGLSCGGVTTAWAAQNRPEIHRALIISPALGFKQLPAAATVLLANLVPLLPDTFTWWDPALQDQSGRPYTYPRYSRHALAQILRLGFATRAQAGRRAPAARSVVMVTNANDDSVDNAAAASLVGLWRAAGAANLVHYEFPAELKLHHDLIDPQAPEAQPHLVFPKLVELADV